MLMGRSIVLELAEEVEKSSLISRAETGNELSAGFASTRPHLMHEGMTPVGQRYHDCSSVGDVVTATHQASLGELVDH